MATKPTPAARLTLVVEYDDVPADREIEDIVEQARGLGTIIKADYEMLKLAKRSFK